MVIIHRTRDDAQALCGKVVLVLALMGLRMSEEKTRVYHINERFDFLGLAHPPSTQTRPRRQASGLELPIEEGVAFGDE